MKSGSTTLIGARFGATEIVKIKMGAYEVWPTPEVIPVSGFDADAQDYFDRVALAGSSITAGNKAAVDALIVGCKADGIWTAIKASCLLAGPDDLTGALVPLVGVAPTNFNFVSGDHSRTLGLIGNASSKYLRSNRAHNADPRDNRSTWAYIATAGAAGSQRFLCDGNGGTSGGSHLRYASGAVTTRCSGTALTSLTTAAPTGFFGISRGSSANYTRRVSGADTTITDASQVSVTTDYVVFVRGTASAGLNEYSNSRISAYGVGEALDLALLDARLATYMAALT